ncbi:hypothetical protein BDV36DRAFT_173251 [Aspergillus pseudocaelatus]|uniref:Uncharacterized protein n=1 Tax=Aspergillus pseudocaelatus TaxID=1825620 RepID=A0ABQ6WKQ0_9EURO|nr:hypothetical protein BDV36DRAFT_173251 [Aspergillus pseudocaelatus]
MYTSDRSRLGQKCSFTLQLSCQTKSRPFLIVLGLMYERQSRQTWHAPPALFCKFPCGAVVVHAFYFQ